MANESTSSTLSELYTEIVAEAQFVINEKSIMKNLVKNYAISGGGKSVEVPIYAAVAAAAVAEATDLSNTAINAAMISSKMRTLDQTIDRARDIAKFYDSEFGSMQDARLNLKQATTTDYKSTVWWVYDGLKTGCERSISRWTTIKKIDASTKICSSPNHKLQHPFYLVSFT